jgi:hypothetical protein
VDPCPVAGFFKRSALTSFTNLNGGQR